MIDLTQYTHRMNVAFNRVVGGYYSGDSYRNTFLPEGYVTETGLTQDEDEGGFAFKRPRLMVIDKTGDVPIELFDVHGSWADYDFSNPAMLKFYRAILKNKHNRAKVVSSIFDFDHLMPSILDRLLAARYIAPTGGTYRYSTYDGYDVDIAIGFENGRWRLDIAIQETSPAEGEAPLRFAVTHLSAEAPHTMVAHYDIDAVDEVCLTAAVYADIIARLALSLATCLPPDYNYDEDKGALFRASPMNGASKGAEHLRKLVTGEA